MKCLKRNMTDFEYLPYSGLTSDLNEDDEHTGEPHRIFDTPVPYQGNISTQSGHTNQYFFGQDTRYSHVLVMDDPKADIQETGLIRWNGQLYDITAIRRSLNAISVALRQQTVDSTDGEY